MTFFSFKILCLWILIASLDQIFAGVYPLSHLDLFSQATIKYINANKVYQQSGKENTIPRTQDLTYAVYGELGVGDRYAILWNVVFLKTLTTDGGVDIDSIGLIAKEREGFSITAIGDIDLGFKFGLLNQNRFQLSTSLFLGLPGSKFQKTDFFDQRQAFESSAVRQSFLENGDTIQFKEQPENQKFSGGIPVGRNDYTITGSLDASYSISINTFVLSLVEIQGGIGYLLRGNQGLSSIIGLDDNENNTDAIQFKFSLSAFMVNIFYLTASVVSNDPIGEEERTLFDSEYLIMNFSSYTSITSHLGLVTAFELGARKGKNIYSSHAFQQGLYIHF